MERTTPTAAGVDAGGIIQFLDAVDEQGFDLHSLMVARDGRVIAEGWAEPYSPHGIQLVYSCSKSFTATAGGFLVTDGVLDVATKVLDHLPWDELATRREEVDPLWEHVRLEHCLSMTVGHEEDAWGVVAPGIRPGADVIDIILGHPPTREPGTVFCYNQVATYLAARVIEDVAGEPLLDLLRRRFFEPLDVGPVESHTDPLGRALGFSGFHVRTEALLDLAQLYLDEGRWGGEQLLDPQWVERACSPYGPPNAPDVAAEWGHGYGFSFWKCTHGYRGDGAFGQFALVLPEQRLAIAMTTETEDMQSVLEAVWEHILPAVDRGAANRSDDELARRLSSLQLLPAPGVATVELEEPLDLVRDSSEDPREVSAHVGRARLEPDGDGWRLILYERGREHVLQVGEQWWNGRLEFDETPEFGRTSLAVATRGGWLDRERFTATIVAVESPHRVNVEVRRSSGLFTATFRHAPLGGTDLSRLGLPGTGGRASV